MKKLSVQCGDWHLGWGLGRHNKLGKLSTTDFETYTWEGYSQGRHGQKSNLGAKYVFKIIEGDHIHIQFSQGSYPVVTEIRAGMESLKALAIEQEQKQAKREARARKKAANTNQTKLL